jgi:hypothetical protein
MPQTSFTTKINKKIKIFCPINLFLELCNKYKIIQNKKLHAQPFEVKERFWGDKKGPKA